MLPLLQLCLSLAGITVIDGLTFWSHFLKMLHGFTANGFDDLKLYWVGWGPDYLSPMNQIQPLMSNTSTSNSAQVNDRKMEDWFIEWSVTTDMNTRYEMIHNISTYIATVLYSHVWVFHPKVISIHSADLYDVAYNALGNFWAYPVKRNETWMPF